MIVKAGYSISVQRKTFVFIEEFVYRLILCKFEFNAFLLLTNRCVAVNWQKNEEALCGLDSNYSI